MVVDIQSIESSATPDGVIHNKTQVNGTTLHYVAASDTGSPLLLVHGFPETWWAFHKVIPLLAQNHRVFAVDLRGFGESATHAPHGSAVSTEDLRQLIAHLDVGPVHIAVQDIAGGTVFRLAAESPELVRSLTAIEMGLAGFGLEGFADVKNGGSWHIGAFATPGVPDTFLVGREREFVAGWFQAMTASADSVTETDLAEFVRAFARPDGWAGAAGLYTSMLAEGDEFKELGTSRPISVPTLAVGGGGGPFTEMTLAQVTTEKPSSVQIERVGHHVALEAPEALAAAIYGFLQEVDSKG